MTTTIETDSHNNNIIPSDDDGDGIEVASGGDDSGGDDRNNGKEEEEEKEEEEVKESSSSYPHDDNPQLQRQTQSTITPQQQHGDDGGNNKNKINNWISRKMNNVNNHQASTTTTQHQSRTKKPQKVLESVYKIGQFKADLPLRYLIVQCFMAGLYKSVGCHTFITIGGGVLGAVFFPVGLIAIILTGAELFTGDLLILVVCFLSGKVQFYLLMRNLCVSWIFNFCGTLVWASLIAYGSGAIEDKGQVDYAIELAEDKTSQPFSHILTKAIGANFLVCLAIWQAMTADDVASKILATWFPIVPFVINGLEHVVANMFFIPLGMMLGADITIGDMLLMNLIPSTIGNIIGGAFGIALSYWYLFTPTQEQLQLELESKIMHHAVTDNDSSTTNSSDQQYHRKLHKHMKKLKKGVATNIFQQQQQRDDGDGSDNSDGDDDDDDVNSSNNISKK